MSRRKKLRRADKAHDHVPMPAVREADRVERLAYSIAQAAEALGVSPSTVGRSVTPFVETIELERGRRLIPIDELERFVAERRRPAPVRPQVVSVGRPAAVPPEVVQRIQLEHEAGKTLGQIGRGLDADRVPTAQGGRRWWPSSVRAVLIRSTAPS